MKELSMTDEDWVTITRLYLGPSWENLDPPEALVRYIREAAGDSIGRLMTGNAMPGNRVDEAVAEFLSCMPREGGGDDGR